MNLRLHVCFSTNLLAKKNRTVYLDDDTNKKTKQNRFYQKYLELRRRINAHSCPVLPATLNTGSIGVNSATANALTVQRSASLKDNKQLRYDKSMHRIEYPQFRKERSQKHGKDLMLNDKMFSPR